MSRKKIQKTKEYSRLLTGVASLLDDARRQSALSVNAILTATYWEIGRRIVEFEQGGSERAIYGEELLKRLSSDLSGRFGKGFSVDNLQRMRAFYLAYPTERLLQTLSGKSGTGEQIYATV